MDVLFFQTHSNYTSWDWKLNETHVLFIDISMTVSDKIYQSHSNYTSWDWNLNEMQVFFIGIWMTVYDYNTNLTVIILVGIGIWKNCMFYSLISG